MTKTDLYAACLAYVQQRIDTATEAMRAAQESANSETKSSAGDKYETGRAMAQLERDRHAQLLADAQRMKQDLEQLNLNVPPSEAGIARAGSLVITSVGESTAPRGRVRAAGSGPGRAESGPSADRPGTFFLSISAGKLVVDGQPVMAVSIASPIGTLLRGKHVGDMVTFNQVQYTITAIL